MLSYIIYPMDLQGKIDKFNVPEIFQLISTGKRTGTLGIIRNNQATMFYFNDGQITYAYSPSGRNRLGERLLEKGYIDKRALSDALDFQKKNGKSRLGKILIENSKINQEQLANVLTEQISDTVYQVMSWDKGLFKFYDNNFPTDEENTISLSTESLILEGAKRADELNNLKSKLPDTKSSLKLRQADDKPVELTLSAEEWNVLAQCDSHHTIDDIINRCDENPEPVLKAIQKLIEMELIGPVKPQNSNGDNLRHVELQIDVLADLLNKFLEKA